MSGVLSSGSSPGATYKRPCGAFYSKEYFIPSTLIDRMSPVVNGLVLFNEIPTGHFRPAFTSLGYSQTLLADFPIPGKTVVYDTSQVIDLDTVNLDRGILIKTLYLSIDPYMRVRMREPDVKSYLPAFELGEWFVAEVIMSSCM